jgi:hypothetical protein
MKPPNRNNKYRYFTYFDFNEESPNNQIRGADPLNPHDEEIFSFRL